MEYFKKKRKAETKPESTNPQRLYENSMPKETVEAAREALQKVLEETAKAWAEVLPKSKVTELKNAGREIAKRYQRKVLPISALIKRALAVSEFIQAAKKLSGASISDRDIEPHHTKKGWFFTCKYCGDGVVAARAQHIEECKGKQQLLVKLGLFEAYRIHAPEGPVYPDLIEVVDGKVLCSICGEEIRSLDDLKIGDGRLGCRTLETVLKQKEAWRSAVVNGWLVKVYGNRLHISSAQQG